MVDRSAAGRASSSLTKWVGRATDIPQPLADGTPRRERRLGRRIDHVGVAVRDIASSLAWWTDRLGLVTAHVEDVLDASIRLAYLDAADSTIQLLQPLRAGPLADWLDTHGEGLHHLCFLADDIPAALDAIRDKGDRRIYPGGRGADVCFIDATPCGVVLELTEASSSDGRPRPPVGRI
jgi:methylmalonyl-CoA/ethylmalonyl-CoA epimerase